MLAPSLTAIVQIYVKHNGDKTDLLAVSFSPPQSCRHARPHIFFNFLSLCLTEVPHSSSFTQYMLTGRRHHRNKISCIMPTIPGEVLSSNLWRTRLKSLDENSSSRAKYA
ncbi:hypothetical protein GALMADRAFT_802146 [Galerina marginata CBS 339.88]|uniref:Uncharacterized protein n=1 Tax=Galerina marginata (strain CBS 339.88) TaxID=685588 RepID=A0A067SWA7_GALM3|nr:hypothetical protein GALMADRAFT_802146 [Galerina marginata CBS 339.88]